jgi:hypothetical protein
MLSLKRGILFSLISIFGVGTACAQTRPSVERDKSKRDEPKVEVRVSASTGKEAERQLKAVERQTELRRKFTEERRKCESLVKDQKLKDAEVSARRPSNWLTNQRLIVSMKRCGFMSPSERH